MRNLMFHLLALMIAVSAHAGAERVIQLTGFREGDTAETLAPGSEFGDPTPPELSADGQSLLVFGSGFEHLEWRAKPGSSPWDMLLSGSPAYQWRRTRLFYEDGQTEIRELIDGKWAESAWDLSIQTWPEWRGVKVLYAGVMTPPKGQKHASGERDNRSRRVFAFHARPDGTWVRHQRPLLGGDPLSRSWVGHSYGSHFIRDDKGAAWVFYERVTEDHRRSPWKTEIFARRMVSPYRASRREHPILRMPRKIWPSAVRGFGGSLIEGPRVTRVKTREGDLYLLGFSTGEFALSNYKMHFAWSTRLLGPYKPILNNEKSDLLDFGSLIRRRLILTQGPGRPVIFSDPKGRWWSFFHAANAEAELPTPESSFIRHLYLLPLDLDLSTRASALASLRKSFLQ